MAMDYSKADTAAEKLQTVSDTDIASIISKLNGELLDVDGENFSELVTKLEALKENLSSYSSEINDVEENMRAIEEKAENGGS